MTGEGDPDLLGFDEFRTLPAAHAVRLSLCRGLQDRIAFFAMEKTVRLDEEGRLEGCVGFAAGWTEVFLDRAPAAHQWSSLMVSVPY